MKQLFLLLAGIAAFPCRADVKPNSLFSDHMVLQRGIDVPVWGTARDGETVRVELAGQTAQTTAANGKWMVRLKPLTAGGPYTLTISGDNTVKIEDVLVGEVWICSGQSNMERQLGPRRGQKPIIGWEKERDAANYPQIREYYVPLKYAPAPVTDIGSRWTVCSPATVSDFSAVGYFFAKHLHTDLKVPVGLLFTAFGGTPAENWTSRAALEKNPELQSLVAAYDAAVKEYPGKLDAFRKEEASLIRQFLADSVQAARYNQALPRRPAAPRDPHSGNYIAGMYNAMVVPLQPYGIKGAIWYQGESNNGRAKQYQTLFPTMIANWRADWKQGDFPFYFVQIAPHKDMQPQIREAQLIAWKNTPNTAMVVTTDCGDYADIHPADKQPVGQRLSLAARALAYGEPIEYSGPVFESVAYQGNKAVLSFKHTGGGLVAKDGPLRGFAIAGADNKFYPAMAQIQGNTIVVSNPLVDQPAAVRFGWENVPDVNLFNKEGLPATPFRTDKE